MNLDKMIEELALTQIMLTKPFDRVPKKSRVKAINELAKSYRENKNPLAILALKLVDTCLNQKRIVGCFNRESLHLLSGYSNGDYSLFLKQIRTLGLFKIIRAKTDEVKVIELVHPLFRQYLLDIGVSVLKQKVEARAFALESRKRKEPKKTDEPRKVKQKPEIKMDRSSKDKTTFTASPSKFTNEWEKAFQELAPTLEGGLGNIQEAVFYGDGTCKKKYKFLTALQNKGLGPISTDMNKAIEKLHGFLNPFLAKRFTGNHADWKYDGLHCKTIRDSVVNWYNKTYDFFPIINTEKLKDPALVAASAEIDKEDLIDYEFLEEFGILDEEIRRTQMAEVVQVDV